MLRAVFVRPRRDGITKATLFDGAKFVDVTAFFTEHLARMDGRIPPVDIHELYGARAVELEVRYVRLTQPYIACFRKTVEFDCRRRGMDLCTRLKVMPAKAMYRGIDITSTVISFAGPRGDFHGERDYAHMKARILVECGLPPSGAHAVHVTNVRGREIMVVTRGFPRGRRGL